MKAVRQTPAAPARPRGKTSWREKLARSGDLPKVVTLGPRQAKRLGTGTCAIPAPLDVDALMRRVPRGRLTTINDLRTVIAQRHGATIGCPITTGIFSWMAAHAAAEAAEAGESHITPYWRTLKTKGELNPKYPGGIPALTARLEAEGHAVVQVRARFLVRDFEKSLARF